MPLVTAVTPARGVAALRFAQRADAVVGRKRGAVRISVNSSTWMRLCSTKTPVGSPASSFTISTPRGGTVSRATPARERRLLAMEYTGGLFQSPQMPRM